MKQISDLIRLYADDVKQGLKISPNLAEAFTLLKDADEATLFATAILLADLGISLPKGYSIDLPKKGYTVATTPAKPVKLKPLLAELATCVAVDNPTLTNGDMIMFEEGLAVATDSHIIVAVPETAYPERGVLLDPKTGETKAYKDPPQVNFPRWRSLMAEQKETDVVADCDLADLLAFATGAERRLKAVAKNVYLCKLLGVPFVIDSQQFASVQSARLIKVCRTLMASGATTAKVFMREGNHGFKLTYFYSDNGAKAAMANVTEANFLSSAYSFERSAKKEDPETETIPEHRTLSIDIETFSSVELTKTGVYPYADSPDFEILLFAYAFDNDPVRCIDLAQGEDLPVDVIAALADESITKKAFNANFERVCIQKYFGIHTPTAQWECTMIKAAMNGLPLSLAAVGAALEIEQEKMWEGKALIRYFCLPSKPTRTNGGRTRNLPAHEPEKWELFKTYCIRDVEAEMEISDKLAGREFPQMERHLYALDQAINDRGILIDPMFVENAICLDTDTREALMQEATRITGLDNPNSVAQLKGWLSEEHGEEIDGLKKADIPALLSSTDSQKVKEVLRIRQELAKTSVKKYTTMKVAAGDDNRIRGLFQFHGANRTGRWAGRLVQMQNLPQNHLKDLDLARQLVRDGDLEMLQMLFGNVPDTLSQLIRTAFVAPPGQTFAVADFSAIEARVIAWLADEGWRLEVFATHGKIYEASASQMFGVPIEEITKGSPLRQKGKVAELALGYQGGASALEVMGALKMGLSAEELPELVSQWRAANPNIVQFWDEVGRGALRAVKEQTTVKIRHGIQFIYSSEALFAKLPSGRCLTYAFPRIGQNRFGSQSLQFMGVGQTTKKWEVQETYGGKLVENLTQAIARDCLAESMLRLDAAGFPIVCHVHDEVICEIPEKDCTQTLARATAMMGEEISWAKGLPLRADGYCTKYYMKD